MKRQLYFFLSLIAGITAGYFIYDYVSGAVFAPQDMLYTAQQQQSLKMSLLIGFSLGILSLFFMIAAWRTRK